MDAPAILAMIRAGRAPLPRFGVVTAVTPSPLSITVTFDGSTTFRPLVLDTALTPAVGDVCALTPTEGDGWLYLGGVLNPLVPTVYQETVVPVLANWQKAKSVTSGLWVYQFLAQSGVASAASVGQVMQGRHPVQSGGDGFTQTAMEDRATVLWHDAAAAFATLAGLSATIQLVTFTITRVSFDGGPEFVTPVMYGHGYSIGGTTPTLAVAPAWTPGYGPARLAPIGKGQTATYIVPSNFVTGLASGAIEGVGFFSESVGDRLTSWRTDAQTAQLGGNAAMRIKYTLP